MDYEFRVFRCGEGFCRSNREVKRETEVKIYDVLEIVILDLGLRHQEQFSAFKGVKCFLGWSRSALIGSGFKGCEVWSQVVQVNGFVES